MNIDYQEHSSLINLFLYPFSRFFSFSPISSSPTPLGLYELLSELVEFYYCHFLLSISLSFQICNFSSTPIKLSSQNFLIVIGFRFLSHYDLKIKKMVCSGFPQQEILF